MKPQFPIYIPSKGRYDKRLTSDALTELGLSHYIIVEEQEYGAYKEATEGNKLVTLLVLDKKYQDEYETCDDLGTSKSKGPGAARNFAWDHSIQNGFTWHWVMDDNIRCFYRSHNNRQIIVSHGAIFKAMEDFCLRYENVAMGGPNYFMFVPRKQKVPPFVMNTRIYSCNLIRNDVPYRWRGRYNEDTDLSLRMLKDRWCTIQFNAFLQLKTTTQKMKGGNTDEFYAKEGTVPKSTMLVLLHPDVARMVFKFGRWHHYVDYSPYKNNQLIKRKECILTGVNEYGMNLHTYLTE